MTSIGLAPDLRSLRRAARLKISELASLASVTAAQLTRWERGLEEASPTELRTLAAVLGCDPAALAAAQNSLFAAGVRGEGYVDGIAEGIQLVERSEAPRSGLIRVLDLFCGSGGFSHGFELTGGFAVTAGVDLLSDRIDTFTANHRAATSVAADIRRVAAPELGSIALTPQVVIGGPPCQGFSSLRPFRERGRGDSRNNLFEEFALVVQELQPEWFVLENVVGLLSHNGGQTLRAVLQAFREAGYSVDWRVLNAAHFGLPQSRERLVVVGNRRGRVFRWPTPTHQFEHKSMAGSRAKRVQTDPLFMQGLPHAISALEAIGDLPPVRAGESRVDYDDSRPISQYAARLKGGETVLSLHEATAHSEKMMEIIRHSGANRSALPAGMTKSGFSSCYSRLDGDRPSVTITVNFVFPSSNKCIHPEQDRALTPREGARLQGFPDAFKFRGTRSQIVKQIGNAVPPVLGECIAKSILDQW